MADEKKLRLLIEAMLDERGFKQTEEALKGLDKQTKQVGETTKNAGSALSKFADGSLGFLRSFGTVAGLVAGALAPIAKSAQDYVGTVKLANATSREWLATTTQIEQAQLKVGKVSAEFFTPIYSKWGDFMEKVGNFAEDNPEATIGGQLVAGGAGTVGIGKLLLGLYGKVFGGGAAAAASTTASAVGAYGVPGGLIGPAMAPTAATAAGGAATAAGGVTALGIAGTVLAGLGLGFGITDLISKTKWGKENEIQPFSKTLPVIAFGLGNLIDKLDAALGTDPTTSGRGMEWAGGIMGGNEQAAGSDKKNYKSLEVAKAQMDFRKQELYAQEDFNRQWGYMNADFNRNRQYQEEDYNRQKGISNRNFNVQQAQSERMFYLQRAIALRDFQISVGRNDYDYALSRKRAQEDQNFSLKQIMLSGDALAYYYSQRQFNISKQRSEEDFQLQKQRSQEDFNRGQADSLMFFGIERAFTLQQFKVSMADRELEYTIMRDRAAWEFENVTKKRMEDEYKIMTERRLAAFRELVLPAFLEGEKLKLFYETQYRDVAIQGYIDAADAMQLYFGQLVAAYTKAGYGSGAATGSTGMGSSYGGGGGGNWTEESMDVGGYAYKRRYQLHDHEYVLTKNTTKALESVAQGRLTQEKVMGLLTGGGSGMTYNDNRQFSRGLSIDEKTILRQELRQLVVEAFR